MRLCPELSEGMGRYWLERGRSRYRLATDLAQRISYEEAGWDAASHARARVLDPTFLIRFPYPVPGIRFLDNGILIHRAHVQYL